MRIVATADRQAFSDYEAFNTFVWDLSFCLNQQEILNNTKALLELLQKLAFYAHVDKATEEQWYIWMQDLNSFKKPYLINAPHDHWSLYVR